MGIIEGKDRREVEKGKRGIREEVVRMGNI